MDFGLAGLFDRFEKTFGEGWTKFILFWIALAILCTCLGLVWSFIGPIVIFLGTSETTASAIRNIAGLVIILACSAAAIVTAIEAKKTAREARRVLADTLDYVEEIEDRKEEYKRITSEARALLRRRGTEKEKSR